MLLHASPLALELMRWCGAVYLIWLGGKLLWSSPLIRANTQAGSGEERRTARGSRVRGIRGRLIQVIPHAMSVRMNSLGGPKARPNPWIRYADLR